MKKISAEIVADSVNPQGQRITSFILTFPRFILAELNTHRMFSRNSASSRAVPFKKMVESVKSDPFIPYAWQKDHAGMQGNEYLVGEEKAEAVMSWRVGALGAAERAEDLNKYSVTKQLCNRVLEPFMWHTALVTTTDLQNFIDLRSSTYEYKDAKFATRRDVIEAAAKDGITIPADAPLEMWLQKNTGQAEIHLMLLVEEMLNARYDSKPKLLGYGGWHIPFGDKIDDEKLVDVLYKMNNEKFPINSSFVMQAKTEIATARAARLSYINYEGKDDYEADLKLYHRLSKSGHWSPFEHVARVMTQDEFKEYTKTVPMLNDKGVIIGCDVEHGWCRNFQGFIQLRAMLD